MKLKFIYWFAHYNFDSPSVRYRALYPLDYFKSNLGINSYLVVPGYSFNTIRLFLKAYFSALIFRKSNSLIIIQRVQSNFIYATLLKLLVKIRKNDTVYDIDDADYFIMNPDTMYFFAKNCEKISAGSKEIGIHLSQFNKQIIFTTSPIVDLNIVKKERSLNFTIGWIGSFIGEHKDSLLELVFPALKQLTFNFTFIIIGVDKYDEEFIKTYFSKNLNINIEIPQNIDWTNENEIQNNIVKFDIGIATLLNTPVQLSKSGIKTKQYMNNGVPVLSTNLPENNSVVIDGYNGYFCDNCIDFNNRLNELYKMSNADYMKLSKNARESIYSFNHEKYYKCFESMKIE